MEENSPCSGDATVPFICNLCSPLCVYDKYYSTSPSSSTIREDFDMSDTFPDGEDFDMSAITDGEVFNMSDSSDSSVDSITTEELEVGDILIFYDHMIQEKDLYCVVVGLKCDNGKNIALIYPAYNLCCFLPSNVDVFRIARFSFETSLISVVESKFRSRHPVQDFTVKQGGEQDPNYLAALWASELNTFVSTADVSAFDSTADVSGNQGDHDTTTKAEHYKKVWSIIMEHSSEWMPNSRGNEDFDDESDDESDDNEDSDDESDDKGDDHRENRAKKSRLFFDLTTKADVEDTPSKNAICHVKLLKCVVEDRILVGGRFELQRNDECPFQNTLLFTGHRTKETTVLDKYSKRVCRAGVRLQIFIMNSDWLKALRAMNLPTINEQLLGFPHVVKITLAGDESWSSVMLVSFQSILGLSSIFNQFIGSTIMSENDFVSFLPTVFPLLESELHPLHWFGRDLDWQCPLSFVCPQGESPKSRIDRATINEIVRGTTDSSLKRIVDVELVWNDRIPTNAFINSKSLATLQNARWLNDDMIDALVYWVLLPLGVKYPRCFSTKLSRFVFRDKDKWTSDTLNRSLCLSAPKAVPVLQDPLIITHLCFASHWVMLAMVNPGTTNVEEGKDTFRGFVLIDSWGCHDDWKGNGETVKKCIPPFRSWLTAQAREESIDFSEQSFPTVVPKKVPQQTRQDCGLFSVRNAVEFVLFCDEQNLYDKSIDEGRKIIENMQFGYNQATIKTMRGEAVAIFDRVSAVEFDYRYGLS